MAIYLRCSCCRSLIPPVHLTKIINTLDSCLGISAGAEITMEADPGTFDARTLKAYMSSGVNRFSIGVQAFSQVWPQVLTMVNGHCSELYRAH